MRPREPNSASHAVFTLACLGLLLSACSTDRAAMEHRLRDTVNREPSGQGTPPVLESVGFHEVLERYQVIYPEFRFHAVDGNVIAIHREIVSGDKLTATLPINPNAFVDVSPARQRLGATYVGGWHCGPERYEVTLRAFLVDANGNHSNALDYTIRCNGL